MPDDELAEVTKIVDGKPRPTGDFLIVEDPESPSTWHLPVKVNGKPDHRLMGAAWAALHGGYRGNKYEGPGKAEAIAKLKALYKSEGLDLPGTSAEADKPAMKKYALGETAWVSVFGELSDMQALGLAFIKLGVALLQGNVDEAVEPEGGEDEAIEPEGGEDEAIEPGSEGEEEAEAAEFDFAESAIGHALTLAEAQPAPGAIVPLHLDVALITPGWGNKRDNYYYPAEVIRRDAGVFSGVKMYETDHRDHERSTRTWVSTVKRIKGFTDDGAPIAEVSVHDESFAKRLLALHADGLLDKMECSILASGTAKPGFELEGRKGKKVESIVQAESVDWVTRAGAGGRALALAECGTAEDGGHVDENKEELVEAEKATFTEQDGPETPARTKLNQAKVKDALSATRLPPASVLKLAELEYADEDALQEAIRAEIAEVKAMTGSGKPFGQGEGTASQNALPSEEQRRERFNQIMRVVGAKEV